MFDSFSFTTYMYLGMYNLLPLQLILLSHSNQYLQLLSNNVCLLTFAMNSKNKIDTIAI